MGWWSAAIMGGDHPLDELGNLAAVCHAEFDTEAEEAFHCYRFTPEKLEKSWEAICKYLRDNAKNPITGQVVGAVYLWTGAKMDEALKSRVVGDAEKDPWMLEGDEERKKYIDKFIEEVENHEPGKRVDIDDEGLLENIAKVMAGER